MRTTRVRGVAAVASTAVVLGIALVAPGAQAATIPTPTGSDPAPAASGAAYLAAQPGADGIIVSHSSYGGTQYDTPSPGETIDAALSLDAVGTQAAEVAKMATGVEASSYSTGSAGSAAKFAAFEYALGRASAKLAPAVAAVDGSISTTGGTAGRLQDGTGTDYESPLTQAYAVKALHDAGAAHAGSALTYLLAQQCPAGYFREQFSAKTATNQACDPADSTGSAPSTDTTAFAVLELQDQKGTPAVATSLTAAVGWLKGQQASNGSYDGNANSTGLAGWALGISGQTASAAQAASWLRAHQLANAGACTPYAAADNGALVVDDLGLANAKAGPLSLNDNSTATYATAQALPALLWAPGGTSAGETTLTGPTGFVAAGSAQTVTISGAPGNTLCITKTGAAPSLLVLGPTGTATVPVALPATTGTASVSVVDAGGETDSFAVTGLAATKLQLKVKPHRVHKGDKLRIKVTGLAPGERVTVTFKGKTKHATANARGHATLKLKATKTGHGKVKAVGAFPDRKGRKGVTVRR